ncbi:MAG: hypothetical protein WD844_08060 [Thermoleophilaceae bacterium]
MGRGSDLLRRAALIAAGAFALHELRYVVGYGGDAGTVAAEHGHAYLSWVEGAVLALVVAAGCAFVFALLVEFRRLHGPAPRRPAESLARSWLIYSAVLAGIYSLQELAEGALAHGHPVGLEGLAGHAGWTAYLLALAIGALVALALRGARDAIALAARPRRSCAAPPRLPLPPLRPALFLPLPRPGVLALNLAGRAPPSFR